MAPAKKSRVKVGNVSLAFYQHADGWRFSWKDPQTGAWKYGTRAKREDALAAAQVKALELAAPDPELEVALQSPEQIALLRRVLQMGITHTDLDRLQHNLSIPQLTIRELIAQFLTAKADARGASNRNYRSLKSTLSHLEAFLGPEIMVHTITTAHIESWMKDGRVLARTRRNRRAVAVTLWRWARARSLVIDQTTIAERTERPLVTRTVPKTWTPQELKTLLSACPASHLPWLAISVWAGMRLEELYQDDPDSGKDVLRWSDLDFGRCLITVRPLVSKLGELRLIPMQPVLRHVLLPLRPTDQTVPVCSGKPPWRKTPQPDGTRKSITTVLAEALGCPWRNNANRHSFISYRAAKKGLGVAALEAGNSETEARKSYHNAKSEAEADQWFSPVLVGGSSDVPIPENK